MTKPSVPVKAHKGSRDTAPLVFNLSNGWRLVVSFLPWQLYSVEKEPALLIEWAGEAPEMVNC